MNTQLLGSLIGLVAFFEAIPGIHHDMYRNDEWLIVDETPDYYYAVRLNGAAIHRHRETFPKRGEGKKWQIARIEHKPDAVRAMIADSRAWSRTPKKERTQMAHCYTEAAQLANKCEEVLKLREQINGYLIIQALAAFIVR